MLHLSYKKYTFNFKNPSGTSRGTLTTKVSYFIILKEEDSNLKGIGECGLLKGLSIDDRPDYEEKLQWLASNISKDKEWLFDELINYPSIFFGLEQAFLSLEAQKKIGDPFILFPSKFTQSLSSIEINGLIWMGSIDFMKAQLKEKLAKEFSCIKIKISSKGFDQEFELLKMIRKENPSIQLRVDANGAFSKEEALKRLTLLSSLDIHSIEQPIAPKQQKALKELCEKSPLPIALDEELIGVISKKEKQILLDEISPQYIILKPSLVGGIKGSQEWIDLAKERKIGWWVTSLLEGNIGLNAIAQWTYALLENNPDTPEKIQGLGTGELYTHNIASSLIMKKNALFYDASKKWDVDFLYS